MFPLTAHFRKHLHQSFMLPNDRPYFRRQNKFVFAEDKKTVGTGPLMNVHVGVEPPSEYFTTTSCTC